MGLLDLLNIKVPEHYAIIRITRNGKPIKDEKVKIKLVNSFLKYTWGIRHTDRWVNKVKLPQDTPIVVSASTSDGKTLTHNNVILRQCYDRGNVYINFDFPEIKEHKPVAKRILKRLDLYVMRCRECGNTTYSNRETKSVKLARESLCKCEECNGTVDLIKEKD